MRKKITVTIEEEIYKELVDNVMGAGLPRYTASVIIQQLMEQFNADVAKFGTSAQLELFRRG